MPVVTIVPKSGTIEDALAARMDELRAQVRAVICDLSGFPEHDVLISLVRCPYRDVDPRAAAVALYADTCPHEPLEQRADELCYAIAAILVRLGFSVGSGAESWLRFLPGSWVQVRDGQVVDSVSHTRK